MIKVTGVRFRQAGKVYYFEPEKPETGAGQPCHRGDSRGIEYVQSLSSEALQTMRWFSR